jgi:hypothetical protein
LKKIIQLLTIVIATAFASSSAWPQSSLAESLTGSWVYQNTWEDKSGDEVTAEESWFFKVEDTQISGWYERRVNKTSKDGRTYSCNSRLKLERRYRKHFTGRITDTGFSLRETKYIATLPGPCENGQYKLFKYTGEFLAGNQLKIVSDSFSQKLSRASSAYRDPPPIAAQGHNLSGIWVWDNNYQDDNDNTITEHEVWKLSQIEDSVFGQYLRTVKYESLDGATFNCNESLTFERKMKLLFSGKNEQNIISLNELSLTNLGDPRCAVKNRKMMQYHGTYDGSEELGLYYGDNKFQRLTRSSSFTLQSKTRNYSRSLSGGWNWRSSQETRNGEIYEVEENFDLQQDGVTLGGSCLRTKRLHAPPGKIFKCNGSDTIELRTLYRLKGIWDDGGFVFFEDSYLIISDSPCDGGKRTRRQYSGIYQGGSEIILTYDDFRQTIRRN